MFLPFTLGVGLLSRPSAALADKIGARTMLIVGPLGAAFAFCWLALGANASLVPGVLAPMTLLGISFAVLVTPLTASVMSSVADADEGLASGVNNAMSRIAQLAGVALSAGVASYASGYRAGMVAAARARRRGRRHHGGDVAARQASEKAHERKCPHVAGIHEVTPSALGCEECLKIGSPWVHLRLCRTCGHVGCCDSSPNKHATKHFHATGHPIIEGYDPPEGWGWCYVDETFVDLGSARRRSAGRSRNSCD